MTLSIPQKNRLLRDRSIYASESFVRRSADKFYSTFTNLLPLIIPHKIPALERFPLLPQGLLALDAVLVV